MNFGTVAVGSSQQKTGTLTAGNTDVTVSSAAWTGQGYSVSGIAFPVTVPAGKSLSYTVTFAPETAGSSTGSVSFASDASNSPTVQHFSGTGSETQAQLGISSSSLSFGTVSVGSSASKTATLSASGSDVTLKSATIKGSGYSVTGISFPVTIAAGQSVSFAITFAPSAAGASTGSITFASNASNSPTAATFSGTGSQSQTSNTPSTSHAVDLSWAASSSSVLGYYVYRGTQSGGPYTKLNSNPSADTSYNDTTVQAGKTYYYVVTSVGTDSVESSYSNQATAVVPSP
jgi:hypothetical protein